MTRVLIHIGFAVAFMVVAECASLRGDTATEKTCIVCAMVWTATL